MRSTSLLLLLLPTLALGAATISNENLALTVDDEGELSITVRASGRVWQTTDQARSEVWAAPEVQGQDRIRWGATLTGADNYTLPVEVEVRLEPWAVAMSWSADADRDMPDLFWPAPLSANLADGRVSFTPYMGGLLLPWTDPSAKWRWMGAAHDLPYVGLSEGAAGEGYALVLDTPHDAALRLPTATTRPARRKRPGCRSWARSASRAPGATSSCRPAATSRWPSATARSPRRRGCW